MNQNEKFDRALLSAFQSAPTSQALIDRVASLRPCHRPASRSAWCALGVTCAAAAVVLAFLALPSTTLANRVLREMSLVRGRLIWYRVKQNGSWEKIGDGWVDGAKTRESHTSPYVDILENPDLKLRIAWSARNGTLSISRGDHYGHAIPEILTPQGLAQFIGQMGIRGHVTTDKSTFDSRPVDCVNIDARPSLLLKIYADPSSQRVLGFAYRNLKVITSDLLVMKIESAEPPADAFEPIFEIGGRKVNVIEDRARWKDKLSKPLASYPIQFCSFLDLKGKENRRLTTISSVINVRSVVRNKDGDIFILYTGLSGPYGDNVIPAIVSDKTGGRYVKSSGFSPTAGGRPEHFSFDGKPLEGCWFVRVSGGELSGPVIIVFKKEFEPLSNLAFKFKAEPEIITSGIPGYMPYMSMPIESEALWENTRLRTLAEDRKDAKDFRHEEILLRRLISLESTTESPSITTPDELNDLGAAIENQGRKGEALSFYRKALKISETSEFRRWEPIREIRKAIRRCGG